MNNTFYIISKADLKVEQILPIDGAIVEYFFDCYDNLVRVEFLSDSVLQVRILYGSAYDK